MRAAVAYGPEQDLIVEEIRLADPEPDEVQVEIKACAICQSDISFIDGHWDDFEPTVFGHEAAGIVTQTGPGVENLRLGDHVIVTLIRSCGSCRHCTHGSPAVCDHTAELGPQSPIRTALGQTVNQGLMTAAFATHTNVHKSQLVKIDHAMPFAQAAVIACAVITGYGAAARSSPVRQGDKVVVIGAGGVGLNIIQTARLRGVDEIIAIDISEDKLETARRFGATHLINTKIMDTSDRLRLITQNQGADHVFVSVGVASSIQQSLKYLARSGSLVIVGIPPLGTQIHINPVELNSFNQRIVGSKMGAARIQEDIPAIIAHAKEGRFLLKELTNKTFSLDEINEAINLSRRAETTRNIIVP